MRLATVSVGLVSPRSTWESIGAETPLRTARSRRREVHALAERADARADVGGDLHTNVRYRIQGASSGAIRASLSPCAGLRARPLSCCSLLLAAPAGAADPRRGEQWNLDLIQSDAAHAVSTGGGAVVAVVDSGVQADHPDLAGRLGPGYDFVQNDATPQDGNGHGTHVSGIIGAASGNGIGVESVAPGATIMPVRVLDDDGGGSTDTVAKGVDYARTHGADVINLSLGSDVPLVGAMGGDAFDAAVHRALAAGIVVVAASGNNGVPVCEQPAASDGLLCVGAVDKRKQRSFFSSFGSGLGLVAPGGSGTGVAGRGRALDLQGLRLRGAGRHLAGRAARVGRRRAAGGARGARAGGGQADPRHGDRPGRRRATTP